MKRTFDFFAALFGLIVLLPFFLVIAIFIKVSDGGPVFYRQTRIGKNLIPFKLLKFRTMRVNADKMGQITVGKKDPRVTTIGHWLRTLKFDEFPQLINILKGEMSVVGPRPEVPEYVNMYTEEQRNVLSVKPGLTDYASILYANESEILGNAKDPQKTYIEEVMPHKLKLNQQYIQEQGFLTDVKIIFLTIKKIWS